MGDAARTTSSTGTAGNRLRGVSEQSQLQPLCVECGAVSKDGAGWRAELAPDLTDPDEVAVYCPDCWEHEFG